jgi:carbamoyltransferase
VQPAAGDAGGALGAALFTWHQLLGHPRRPDAADSQQGSLLGPAYSPAQVAAFLRGAEAVSHCHEAEEGLLDAVAGLLADGKAVGWFCGRMEFGPRALGARSILADPRRPDMHARLNRKIKFRESFRPFAPCVLREHAAAYFRLPPGVESPYMLYTVPVADGAGLPAVTHVDGSARVQTVDAGRHGRFYRLLRRFHEKTGCPVLVNTSFNIRGEPIVCSPADAYRCFLNTDLDALVLENHLLLKEEQSPRGPRRSHYPARLALD